MEVFSTVTKYNLTLKGAIDGAGRVWSMECITEVEGTELGSVDGGGEWCHLLESRKVGGEACRGKCLLIQRSKDIGRIVGLEP